MCATVHKQHTQGNYMGSRPLPNLTERPLSCAEDYDYCKIQQMIRQEMLWSNGYIAVYVNSPATKNESEVIINYCLNVTLQMNNRNALE